MIAAPLPLNEACRLRAVNQLGLVDTAGEERFDRLTRITARLFDVPIALISLVDENRQWFKSSVGFSIRESPRDISFCAHTILTNQPLIIPDTLLDPRFHDNPLVTNFPHIRFYAGIPLETKEKMLVGALCLLDSKPRIFPADDLKVLKEMAGLVQEEMNSVGTNKLIEVLSKTEESFSSAFAFAAIGMALVSPDGHWLKVNQALCDLLGYSEEDLYGKDFQGITHPDDLKNDLEHMHRLLAGKIPSYHIEKRYYHKDGHFVWISLSVSLVRDAQNKPLYFISQLQDISERKTAEQNLIRNMSFLEAKVDSSVDGIMVVDNEGVPVLLNKRMQELWRIPLQVIRTMTRSERRERLAKETTNPEQFSRQYDEIYAEPKQARRDEIHLTSGLILDRYTSPVIGRDGISYGRIWTYHDITESKLAEEELDRMRTEYERILSAVEDGVHWIGLDGLIKFQNPAASKMLGYRISELIGRPAHETLQPTRADGTPFPESSSFINATLRDGEVRRVFDEVFWRKNRTMFDVEYTCTPIHDKNGQPNGAVVTFVDVTERKKAQAEMQNARLVAESANRAKTEFLANMSHEIRTPLNGIIGMTDLMTGTPMTNEQKDFLEIIHTSGENLLSIVNDVLDFSKIEFGKLELDHHAFSLLDLIDDVVGLLNFRIAKKNLNFVYGIEQGLPVDYWGDATRIRQVLVNLVTNAIKFTEHGEIGMEVSPGTPKPYDKPEVQRLVFRVRDTGIGIPADRLDRLFKVFSQVDASTTRRYGGSGLGLAICQKLVEIMGGRIQVESVADKGSTFSFELLLARAHPETNALPETSALAGHRVLIVDDNPTNRRMLGLQLSRWKMTFLESSGAAEALDLIKKGERFDVALIDCQMPTIDGVMLAREIRQTASTLPLILVSSQTGDVGADELRQAGFAAVIAKPVRQNILRSTLQEILGPAPGSLPEAAPAKETRPQRPLKILIVEDNVTNQKVAQQSLKRLGYTSDLANNGFEAIAATEKKVYDLILMDVHMPGMDGLEATKRIRQQPATGPAPKIIALTADVLKGEREVCLEAGMDDYLTKPFKIDLLKSILEGLSLNLPEVAGPSATAK
jgi:PAS domain S-box-containing protein